MRSPVAGEERSLARLLGIGEDAARARAMQNAREEDLDEVAAS